MSVKALTLSQAHVPFHNPANRERLAGVPRGAAMSPPWSWHGRHEFWAGSPTSSLHLLLKDTVDQIRVLGQVANDRMLIEEGEQLLTRRLALEERAHGLEPVRAVRKGDGTGFFQAFVGMLVG